MSFRLRRLIGVTVFVAFLSASVTAGFATTAPSNIAPIAATVVSPAGQTGLDQISGCLSSKADLEALVVVDESQSLDKSDPDNRRALILADAITSLGNLATQKLTTVPRRVDVAISTFATSYTPWIPWTTLDPVKTKDLANQVRREIPGRKNGAGTDHPKAYEGARKTLAQGVSRFPSEAQPCKILLFFSDGQLDISSQTEINDAAAIKMCDPGGIITGIRNDGVNIVNIFLSNPKLPDQAGLAKGSKLLRGIAEGSGGGIPPTCGAVPILESASAGVFLEGSADALSSRFGTVIARSSGGTEISGLTGSPVNLRVDQGVNAFRVIANAANGFTLTTPSGAVLAVPLGGPGGAVGDTTADVSWVGSTATISVPITNQTGNWVLARQGESQEFSFFLFSGLQIDLADGKLVVGRPSKISGQVLTADGQPADLTKYTTAALQGETQLPDGTKSPIQLALDPVRGTFKGEFTPSTNTTEVVFSIGLSLVTRNIDNGGQGQKLADVIRTFGQPVRLAEVFPTIDPQSLTLSALEGKKGVAKGDIKVTGSPFGETQVCLGKVALVDVADPASFVVTGDNRCEKVGVGETKPITIEVRNSISPVDGQVKGSIPLRVTSAATPTAAAIDQDQLLPLTFSSFRPVDQIKRFEIFLALLIIGLLFPLLVLNFVNRRSAKLVLVQASGLPIKFANLAIAGTVSTEKGSTSFNGTLVAFVPQPEGGSTDLLVNDLNRRLSTNAAVAAGVAGLASGGRNGADSTTSSSAQLMMRRAGDSDLPLSLQSADFAYIDGAETSVRLWTGRQGEELRSVSPGNPFGQIRAEVRAPDGRVIVSSVDPSVTKGGARAGMSLDPSNQFYLILVLGNSTTSDQASAISPTVEPIEGYSPDPAPNFNIDQPSLSDPEIPKEDDNWL